MTAKQEKSPPSIGSIELHFICPADNDVDPVIFDNPISSLSIHSIAEKDPEFGDFFQFRVSVSATDILPDNIAWLNKIDLHSDNNGVPTPG